MQIEVNESKRCVGTSVYQKDQKSHWKRSNIFYNSGNARLTFKHFISCPVWPWLLWQRLALLISKVLTCFTGYNLMLPCPLVRSQLNFSTWTRPSWRASNQWRRRCPRFSSPPSRCATSTRWRSLHCCIRAVFKKLKNSRDFPFVAKIWSILVKSFYWLAFLRKKRISLESEVVP